MEWWHILVTVLGSGTFVTLLEFFINCYDSKKKSSSTTSAVAPQITINIYTSSDKIEIDT